MCNSFMFIQVFRTSRCFLPLTRGLLWGAHTFGVSDALRPCMFNAALELRPMSRMW
jgi:hypothetical protein